MDWEEAHPCKEAMHFLWDRSPLKVPSKLICPHIKPLELPIYKFSIIKACECNDEHTHDLTKQLACEFWDMLKLLQCVLALLDKPVFVKIIVN